MFDKQKRSILQAIAILMMLFVQLPCTSKRSIKEAFGIPVSVNATKPHSVNTCSAFNYRNEHQLISRTIRTKQTDWNKGHLSLFTSVYLNRKTSKSSHSYYSIHAIPIYKLHQRYLI